MNCKNCKHMKAYRKFGNATQIAFCEHPDKEYIRTYFKEHRIRKYEGYLGFINSKGVFPIKTSPKWCPLKKGGEGE